LVPILKGGRESGEKRSIVKRERGKKEILSRKTVRDKSAIRKKKREGI